MKQVSKLGIVSAMLFALMFGYQNCSVYKSEGRKFLESNGTSTSLAEDSGQSFSKMDSASCEQYLSSDFLKQISSASGSEIRAIADIDNMSLYCMYSLYGETLAFDHLSCSFSADHHSEVNFPVQNSEVIFKKNNASILLSAESSSEETCYLMGPEIGQIGAKCCVNEGQKAQVDEILLELSKEILNNIR